MKALLWILGGILVLDVLLVAVFAVCAAVVRRRARRAAVVAETRTPEPSDPPRLVAVPDDGTELVLSRSRGDDEPVPAGSAERGRSRSGGHRVAGIALVAAMVFAGSAVASPEVRRFVTTAIEAVSSGLGSSAVEPFDASAAGAEPAPISDAIASPRGSVPSPRTSGERPRLEPSDGPAVDPRPTGAPHGVAVPPAPTSVSAVASPSGGEITVTWDGVAGATAYVVERAPDGSSWGAAAEVGGDVTRFDDTGLAAGSTYFYRVVALDGDGASDPSNVVSATTPLPPSATTISVLAATADRVELGWQNVEGETGYRIERSGDAGGPWEPVATQGQDVTTATDLGVAPASTYWYRIVPFNGAGDAAASDPVSATTEPARSPDDPGGGDESGSIPGGSTDRAAERAKIEGDR